MSYEVNSSIYDNVEVKNSKKYPSLTSFQIIKVLLRERAMKQTELADKIGMTRQGLNNYIRGFWAVPTQIKLKIAEALEVDSAVIWDLPQTKKECSSSETNTAIPYSNNSEESK